MTIDHQDSWGLVHFSQDKTELLSRIQQKLEFSKSTHLMSPEEMRAITILLNLVAEKFHGKTLPKEDLDYVRRIINTYRRRNFSRIKADSKISWEKLEKNLKKTVLDCAEKIDENCEFNDPPRFVEEKTSFAQLMDHILVNWPYSRDQTITLRNRRATLRRYAEEALNIFRCAHSDAINFYDELKITWNRRAQLFFDGQDSVEPYISHMYTLDQPTPYTLPDNKKFFINRRQRDFESRNPPASKFQVNQILKANAAGDGRYRNHDIYSEYENNGMTSSDHYFEYHLSQFYRIMFYFLELQDKGDIWSDQDDTYRGLIPFDRVPERIQAIIHDDNAYREYLLEREKNAESFVDSNKNLFGRVACYRIEDLLVSLVDCVDRRRPKTLTTSTSTGTNATSTPVKYEDSKRGKGIFSRLPSGKCIPLSRCFQVISYGNNNKCSNNEATKKFKNSQDELVQPSGVKFFND